MNLEIRLHVGAHKTATTHAQETLFNNRERLAEAGVCYIERRRLRRIFTRPFYKVFRYTSEGSFFSSAPTLRAAIRDELAGKARQFSTLALSEENIMGDIPFLARTGRLYGNRRDQLNLVKLIFQECPITVILTIRNYNDFYPSAYAQLIKQGGSVTYGDFLRKMDFENNTWRAIVADLSQIFGRDKVRLFRYEDYPANLELLLESIVGRKLPLETDAAKIVYPSLNVKGIEVLLAAGRILSAKERVRLGFYLAHEFAFDREYERPSIQDPALRELLDRMYQRDTSELATYFRANKPDQ